MVFLAFALSPVYVLSGQGEILEAGTGPAPLDCFQSPTGIGRQFVDSELADAEWIRVAWEDGSEVVVGVAQGIGPSPIRNAGIPVVIDYRYQQGDFGPSDSHLERPDKPPTLDGLCWDRCGARHARRDSSSQKAWSLACAATTVCPNGR